MNQIVTSNSAHTNTHTHVKNGETTHTEGSVVSFSTHSILTDIFPSEPGLAGCFPLHVPTPLIPRLYEYILLGKAQTLDVFHDTDPQVFLVRPLCLVLQSSSYSVSSNWHHPYVQLVQPSRVYYTGYRQRQLFTSDNS